MASSLVHVTVRVSDAHQVAETLKAAVLLAESEHLTTCGAKCTCGAFEQRNEARAEFYRRLDELGARRA